MLEAKFDNKVESSESGLAAMPGRNRKMYTTPELLEYGPVAALTQGGGSALPDSPTTHA
jgi:hypothetical protein